MWYRRLSYEHHCFAPGILLGRSGARPRGVLEASELDSAQRKQGQTLLFITQVLFLFPGDSVWALLVTNPSSAFCPAPPCVDLRGRWGPGSFSGTASCWAWVAWAEERNFSRSVWLPPGLGPDWSHPQMGDPHLSNLWETKDPKQFKIHGPNVSKRITLPCQIFPENADV